MKSTFKHRLSDRQLGLCSGARWFGLMVLVLSGLGCAKEPVEVDLVVTNEGVLYQGKSVKDGPAFFKMLRSHPEVPVTITRAEGVQNLALIEHLGGWMAVPPNHKGTITIAGQDATGKRHVFGRETSAWVYVSASGELSVAMPTLPLAHLPQAVDVTSFLKAMKTSDRKPKVDTIVVATDGGPVELVNEIAALVLDQGFETVFELSEGLRKLDQELSLARSPRTTLLMVV